MPELPEVETTVRGLKKEVVGLRILDVWTDLDTKDKRKADTISNKKYFALFKKQVIGQRIISVERRAKNILVNLHNKQTILIHMKMTGHLLYGKYTYNIKLNTWSPVEDGPLKDPFNRFVHVVFSLSNKSHLVFSDTRKFGKITLLYTSTAHDTKHLKGTGPEPLDKNFSIKILMTRLQKKPKGNIKTVLMDPLVLAGIGNIYSDEILWHSNIHPERKVINITTEEYRLILKSIRYTLKRGIDFGGDSMSDYRNIYGEKGKFQLKHEAYRRTGQECRKKGCGGKIIRKIINGRSAHFCSEHQK